MPDRNGAASFNERELRTIMAALRYWQERMLRHPLGLDPDQAEGFTARGRLSAAEIDELCERLGEGL